MRTKEADVKRNHCVAFRIAYSFVSHFAKTLFSAVDWLRRRPKMEATNQCIAPHFS